MKYISNNFWYLLLLLIITRILIFAVIFFGASTPGIITEDSFRDSFFHWDTEWYLDIAQNGYEDTSADKGELANYAFLPFYPLLMSLLGDLIGNFLIAGLLISNLSLLVGVVYLYRLAKLEQSQGYAEDVVKVVIFLPTAFIFSAVLTEGLFFMLLMMTLYYARLGKWPVALLTAVLLGATRSVGIFVVIPMLFEYLSQQGIYLQRISELNNWRYLASTEFRQKLRKAIATPKILTLPLAWSGFLVFMLYIGNKTGDLLAIFNIQEAWGREFINPVIKVFTYLFSENTIAAAASWTTLLVLILFVLYLDKIKLGYWIMGMLMIIMPLTNSAWAFHMHSMPRYLLLVFPLYFILVKVFAKNRKLFEIFLYSSLILQTFLAFQWARDGAMVV